MGFGIALLVLGGFLLGGAYSVWSSGGDPAAARGRGGPQVAFAVPLLLAALLATTGGVLYLL